MKHSKEPNWDRIAVGSDKARQRAKLGTRKQRRAARFAELKAEEKKRRKAAKRKPIISVLHDYMGKKNWKK